MGYFNGKAIISCGKTFAILDDGGFILLPLFRFKMLCHWTICLWLLFMLFMGFFFEVCPTQNESFIAISHILVINCQYFLITLVIVYFIIQYPFINLDHNLEVIINFIPMISFNHLIILDYY